MKITTIRIDSYAMTHEEKAALQDVVINIVIPILADLYLFEKHPDDIDIKENLKKICREAERKVRDFKCENHCYHGEICREYKKKQKIASMLDARC